MKIDDGNYVVYKIGEYQIWNKNNESILLKFINDESIVETKTKKFLILSHCVINTSEYEFLQNKLEPFRIQSKHILHELSNCDQCYGYSDFINANLIYTRLIHGIKSAGVFKLVFELDEIELFSTINNKLK